MSFCSARFQLASIFIVTEFSHLIRLIEVSSRFFDEDTSISLIRCENSVTINIEASWNLAEQKDTFYTNVYGTKGSIGANPFKLIKVLDDEQIDLGSTFVETPTEAFKKSYLNELKSFIGAIKGLNPVFSSGEEALQLLKIAEAMYLSADKDQEIKINY